MTTSKITVTQKVAITLIAVGVLLAAGIAYANPLYTAGKARSALATSTLAYMTPGTATSTLVYDSYEQLGTNQPNQGNITIPNTVALAIQGVGSSTASIVNLACEYSDDGIDWYQNEMFPATTSDPVLITAPNTFTFTNASSTIGGVAFNGFKKIITCPLPTRFVRAVASVTGDKAAIWDTFIPSKQRN